MNNHTTNDNKKISKRSFLYELTSLSGDKIAHLIINFICLAIESYIYYCFVVAFMSSPGMFDMHNYFIEVPIVIAFLTATQISTLIIQLIQYKNAYNDGRLRVVNDIHPFDWCSAIFCHGSVGKGYEFISNMAIVPLLWFILMSYNCTMLDINEVNKNYPYIKFLLWCLLRVMQINLVYGFIMGVRIGCNRLTENTTDD